MSSTLGEDSVVVAVVGHELKSRTFSSSNGGGQGTYRLMVITVRCWVVVVIMLAVVVKVVDVVELIIVVDVVAVGGGFIIVEAPSSRRTNPINPSRRNMVIIA